MSSLELLKQYKYADCDTIHNLGYSIKLFKEDDIYEWDVVLLGAPDSLYNGGIFHIKLSFPKDYPKSKPEIIFLTPIYHLNVNPLKLEGNEIEPLGHVSVSFINWWNPKTTVKEILIQLYSIFYLQTNDSPYGLDRSIEFLENRPLYDLKTKYFTKKYANQENLDKGIKYDDKDWDFSCNENELKSKGEIFQKQKESNNANNSENKNIELIFEINGKKQVKIKCGTNELTRDVMERSKEDLGITDNTKNLLYIFNRRRLNLELPIKENGLNDNSEIIVIYDVIYA